MKLSPLPLILLFISLFSFAQPSVWQAEKEGVTYTLLGSIHAGKKSFYPLPDAATHAFNNSNGLIVEADITSSAQPNLSEATFTAEQVLSSSQIDQLRTILDRYSLSPERYLQLPPWLLAITLQLLQMPEVGLQAELGIDLFYLQQAHQNRTPVYELEGVDFQITLFQNVDQEGAELLIDTLSGWGESKQELICLIDAWQQGDDEALDQLLQQHEYSQPLADQLIYERNNQWVHALTTNQFELADGQYFIVVGALHLVGKQGLLQQLQQQGYTVTKLTNSSNSLCNVN